MDFDFLESQVDKRRRMDEEMYEDAFSDLASVLGIRTLKKQHETNGAVEEILSYMDCEIPEVPESLTEINSRLEYMLRPSGTMKRRVELYGNWWKNATGCFLGSTKDGDVIALIPGKWGGYRYKDKTGKIIKIKAVYHIPSVLSRMPVRLCNLPQPAPDHQIILIINPVLILMPHPGPTSSPEPKSPERKYTPPEHPSQGQAGRSTRISSPHSLPSESSSHGNNG